jgi:hypothetical protein
MCLPFAVLDGQSVVRTTAEGWAEWMNMTPIEDRCVALTEIGDVCTVSTIFFGGIFTFETLVFGGPRDEWAICSDTWAQAELAHAMAVAAIRAEMGYPDATP